MRTLSQLLTLVLLPVALFAQPRGDRHHHETFAERRVHDLTRRFDLTEAQRTQALTLFTEADKEAEPLEERLEQAHRALRDATRRNATGSEIDQLAVTVGTLTGQLAAINAKADTAFHNTLTPKQREGFQRGPRGRKGPPPPHR